MLREWRSELNQPSPTPSLQGGSLGSFSPDIGCLLQLCEEEDDATSRLAAPKTELGAHVQTQVVAMEQNYLIFRCSRARQSGFDKPRRAFESGSRKQRSLPDYNGRRWHESRKQVIEDVGGLKRSYYMDPQPSKHYEWHLYEYQISKGETCALYRLELKLVDGKKIPQGKPPNGIFLRM